MKVFLERENEWKNVDFTGNAGELLAQLGVNPQTVLVLKDDVLVTEDVNLEDAGEVKILTVVSGG